jgi:hypothetical protein
MRIDPEIDDFLCQHLNIAKPMTFAKLKNAAISRDLPLQTYMTVKGVRYVLDHKDPTDMYKTKTAAYREGLIRWVLTNVYSPSTHCDERSSFSQGR